MSLAVFLCRGLRHSTALDFQWQPPAWPCLLSLAVMHAICASRYQTGSVHAYAEPAACIQLTAGVPGRPGNRNYIYSFCLNPALLFVKEKHKQTEKL